MKTTGKFWTVLVISISIGCDDAWVGADPANTPQANFDIFWQSYDQHYSYFPLRGVDWDSAYRAYRPRVNAITTDEELFAVLTNMGALLQDGHFFIGSDDYRFYYSYRDNTARAAVPVHPFPAFGYLENERSASASLTYATFRGTNVGYLRVTDLDGDPEDYTVVDKVLDELRATEGLIVDARTTGGGDPNMAEIIAGRLAGQSYTYRRYKYRNGSNRNDYTGWIDDVLLPAGERYARPVVMLTDRRCFSACESFAMMMRVLPDVITLGDTTFGGTGRPVWQELPNGWSYRISTWYVTQVDGQVVEGVGVAPEVVAPYNGVDSLDNTLERAIELLTEGS